MADELGWGNKSVVTQYTNIVSLLHKRAYEFAKNHTFVNTNKRTFANIEFANANLKESHFRAFLSALPCPAGSLPRRSVPGYWIREWRNENKI